MSIRDSNDSAPFAGIRMPSEVLDILHRYTATPLHRYQVSEGTICKKNLDFFFSVTPNLTINLVVFEFFNQIEY